MAINLLKFTEENNNLIKKWNILDPIIMQRVQMVVTLYAGNINYNVLS